MENFPNLNPTTSPKKAETSLSVRPPRLKIFLLSILAVVSVVVAWKNASKNEGKDFYQFWVVGQSLNRPEINIYSDEARDQLGAEFLLKAQQMGNSNLMAVAGYRGWLQTYSTPFLYATFRFFSTGNYNADLRNYRLLMLAALAAGIFIFCRLLNQPWTLAVIIFSILLIWFDPLASDFYVGNVNCLQFGALAVYLWTVVKARWRFRDLIGGAILGLALAFKPNLVFVPVVLAACWILEKNFWRLWLHTTGGIIGGAFAILLASASFHNFHSWNDWLLSLRSLSADNVIAMSNGNFSPAQIIHEQFHVNISLPLAIVFTMLVIWPLWRRRNTSPMTINETSPEVFSVVIGCLLTVVASRLTWFHYYVLTIPAFIFLLPPSTLRKPGATFILRQIPWIFALIALTPIPSMIVQLDTNEQAVLAASAALLLLFSLIFLPRHQTMEKI